MFAPRWRSPWWPAQVLARLKTSPEVQVRFFGTKDLGTVPATTAVALFDDRLELLDLKHFPKNNGKNEKVALFKKYRVACREALRVRRTTNVEQQSGGTDQPPHAPAAAAAPPLPPPPPTPPAAAAAAAADGMPAVRALLERFRLVQYAERRARAPRPSVHTLPLGAPAQCPTPLTPRRTASRRLGTTTQCTCTA